MRFEPSAYDAILKRLVLGGTVGDEAVAGNPNMAVPWFCMAVFAYEELDDPFLTDSCFDWLCGFLDERWDGIEHRHKSLIDRAALKTSTGSYLVGKLPTYIQHATKHLLTDYASLDEIRPLPTPDIGDLLGTIKKVEQDVADLLGLPKVVVEPNKSSSLADLLGVPAPISLGDLL